jgi:hypothetical protein
LEQHYRKSSAASTAATPGAALAQSSAQLPK